MIFSPHISLEVCLKAVLVIFCLSVGRAPFLKTIGVSPSLVTFCFVSVNFSPGARRFILIMMEKILCLKVAPNNLKNSISEGKLLNISSPKIDASK